MQERVPGNRALDRSRLSVMVCFLGDVASHRFIPTRLSLLDQIQAGSQLGQLVRYPYVQDKKLITE